MLRHAERGPKTIAQEFQEYRRQLGDLPAHKLYPIERPRALQILGKGRA